MQPSLFADDLDETATAEKPTIGAIVPWFGSKRNLAPRIVEVIGPHQAYWELFGGSLAVLLAKPVAT
ncbi:MAG: DNA adenine methylase, partial [Planctomycetaceae bacterium]